MERSSGPWQSLDQPRSTSFISLWHQCNTGSLSIGAFEEAQDAQESVSLFLYMLMGDSRRRHQYEVPYSRHAFNDPACAGDSKAANASAVGSDEMHGDSAFPGNRVDQESATPTDP